MSEKYLVFGATGSVGSSLAEQLKNSGNDIHLVARNESEVKVIAEKLGCSYTVADVLEDEFKNYLAKSKKPFMATFYKEVRKKSGILMGADGNPIGGKWSFDEDNRNHKL